LFHIVYEFGASSAQPYDVWPGKDIYKNVAGPLIAILPHIDNPPKRERKNSTTVIIYLVQHLLNNC
jgi:hypothetical protein